MICEFCGTHTTAARYAIHLRRCTIHNGIINEMMNAVNERIADTAANQSNAFSNVVQLYGSIQNDVTHSVLEAFDDSASSSSSSPSSFSLPVYPLQLTYPSPFASSTASGIASLPWSLPSSSFSSSYEDNIALSERLGIVEIGVSDIDCVAPLLCDKPTTIAAESDVCPICFEALHTLPVRRTLCDHDFCSFCITKWLSKHKACPVCKRDVQDMYDETPRMTIQRTVRRRRLAITNADASTDA